MYELIVLGLIPGTNIELTFSFWLMLASALLSVVAIRKLHPLHLLRNGIVTFSLFWATRRQHQA
jgi:hypothetical protein